MSLHAPRSRCLALLATGACLSITAWAAPAQAAADRDGDGMPNRWEVRHDLDPDRANASGDPDADGVSNLREYRRHGHPQHEDSDRDGHDDGDELSDGDDDTSIDDPDSDDDDVKDGDEDSDDDGLDNEDEDDSSEGCVRDDDDRDDDHVADEDENDYGYRAGDSDSDDDDVLDGNEDSDSDGQSNEDDDDSDDDRCGRHGGEDDDDELGTIVSFEAESGDLVISTIHAGELTFVVTDSTEIEWDTSGHGGGDNRVQHRSDEAEGSVDDLDPGVVVAEVDLEDDGTLEEIELKRPA